MEPNPPNFALLLGKRLSKKESAPPEKSEREGLEESPPALTDMPGDTIKAEEMQNSAASAMLDAIASKDVAAFKDALSDFLEMRGM